MPGIRVHCLEYTVGTRIGEDRGKEDTKGTTIIEINSYHNQLHCSRGLSPRSSPSRSLPCCVYRTEILSHRASTVL